KVFVSMPGVPFEMQGMMEDHVLPELAKHFSLPHISHRTLVTAGIGEAYLADHISHFEAALPAHIRLAYLPGYGQLRLRLTAHGDDAGLVEQELQYQFK